MEQPEILKAEVPWNQAVYISRASSWKWRRKWQATPVFLPGKSHGQEPGGLQSVGLKRVRHE